MNSDGEELPVKDEDILESDINFEDLIKVSNVSTTTQSDTKDESKIEGKSTVSTVASSSQSTTTTSSTTIPTIAAKVAQKVTVIPTVSTTGTTATVAATVTVTGAAGTTTATATTSTSTKATTPGQVVIIQGPSGTSVPIRIATSANVNAQQANNQNKKVTIQVLKMPDGSFVHLKNNKQLNLTNLSNVTHMNIGNKKNVTTTGNQQSIVIKNLTTSSSSSTSSTNVAGTTQSKVTTTANLGTQILKSVSSMDNSKITVPKAKILENIKIQKADSSGCISSVDNANTGAVTTSNNTITVMTTTSNTGGTTKQNDSATTKQIIVPHHVLKLSPNSSGTVQAIQIPGKTGFQYVRVLGANTSTANSSTSAKILNPTTTVSSRDSGTATTTTQLSTGQKLILNTKSRQNSTPIILNKDTVVVSSQPSATSTQKQQAKSLITIPTLRKITENGKTLTIIKKERSGDDDDDREEKPKIIKIQNSISQNTTISGNKISNGQKFTSGGKIPHVFMVSKDFLKKNNNDKKEKTIEIIASIKTESSPQKKLYSVLKPSLHDSSISENLTDDNNSNSFSLLNRKRSLSPPDVPRRKHCNCTKSQCLKLYCDCFANSEFCQDCNCKECFNNLENENERQKAIKICLERNPNAFKPKITKARDQSDTRLHNKGCNCKRSGCLKNYCECYEAKIACSSNCKCLGCRNVEDRSDVDQMDISTTQHIGTSRQSVTAKRTYDEMRTATAKPSTSSEAANKQAYNFITEDVVDATVQCMFAQTEECKKSEINGKNSERMVIEELGRCLVEIIDFSIRNMDN